MRWGISKATLLALILVDGAGLCLASSLHAQTYPSRPIRFVIPFSPGGADVVGRMLAQNLSEALGEQVVVDNRPGAGSTIGAEQVAKAAPDGHTLLLISSTHFVSAALHRKLAYDAVNDFEPVTQITSAPNVLVVHPSLPVKTVKDLIVLARSKSGQIDYASSGNGSFPHLAGALFLAMTGAQMTHIPYRGSGPMRADLLGGHVMVGFPGISGLIPLIKAGKLRALGVTSGKRSPALPDVPTVAEAGVKGYEASGWFGVAGPKGIPRDIVLKLHGEILRVLQNPEVQKRMLFDGNDATWQDTPERFGEMLKIEAAKWAKVVRDSGARVD